MFLQVSQILEIFNFLGFYSHAVKINTQNIRLGKEPRKLRRISVYEYRVYTGDEILFLNVFLSYCVSGDSRVLFSFPAAVVATCNVLEECLSI